MKTIQELIAAGHSIRFDPVDSEGDGRIVRVSLLRGSTDAPNVAVEGYSSVPGLSTEILDDLHARLFDYHEPSVPEPPKPSLEERLSALEAELEKLRKKEAPS